MTLGRVLAFTLSSALLAALGACAGGYSHQDQLQRRVDQFNNDVRWGRFYSASELIRDPAREPWLAAHRGWGDDLRIADYEVLEASLNEEDDTAVVRVSISWYRLSQSELQTTLLTQRWRREDREWWLQSEEVEEGSAPM